jgi:hypothetical protein
VESVPARLRKWSLNKGALDAFLNRLDPDPDRAGAEYEKIRQKLLRFFRGRDCGREDEKLVDDTIDVVIRRLHQTSNPSGEIEDDEIEEIRDLPAFILGVARNIAKGFWEEEKRSGAVALDEAALLRQPMGRDPEEEQQIDQWFQRLEECMQLLDPKDREFIMQWHLYQGRQKIENRKRLARLRRVSPGTLRKQIYDAHGRLRQLVKESLGESRKR